jgi:thiol-disulfide isomerase/thioredoxin
MGNDKTIPSKFLSKLGTLPSFVKNINNFDYVVHKSNAHLSLTVITNDTSNIDNIFNYCNQTYEYLANAFYKNKYKFLKLLLIMHKHKRTLPERNGQHIDKIHVNGGLCIFRPQMEYDILVYREEDCIKVLTHEIIHFFEIDGIDKYSSIHEIQFAKKHNIESSIHIAWFEAVTETYAIHLLCKFGYYDPDKITKQVWKLAKRYVDHFKTNNSNIKYKEHTHAFMYIIGRVALWCSKCKKADERLIKLIENRNVHSKYVLKLIEDKYPKILGDLPEIENDKSKSLRVDYL